jgi:hypothetical protein
MGFELKAEEMGVTVIFAHPPHGWWGSYNPDKHAIMVRPDLGYIQARSTGWHELGHARYRHVGCTPKQERQARMWAARHLIRPQAFIDAARITDDLLSIAARLNVMPDDVKAFQQSLSLEELIHFRKEINGHAD